jgi:hypothetical protein
MTLRRRALLGQRVALALAAAPVGGAQPKPIVVVRAPAAWADFDTRAVKGRPARLAW